MSEMKRPPAREEVLGWPVFPLLGLADIDVPRTREACEQAAVHLLSESVLGFDTEVRPTFHAGAAPRGPDVVQFATGTRAWVFQLNVPGADEAVRRVLNASTVLKVGFDLTHDQAQLQRRVRTVAKPLLDLDTVFHRQGYQRTLGVKSAIALLFGQRLMKSKKTTTSNWSVRQLEPRQVLYAANDAYAAWVVWNALDRTDTLGMEWATGLPPVRDPA